MSYTEFRLKTAVEMVGVTAPVAITPTIAEPVQWSSIAQHFEADDQYHGIQVSYSQGELKLVFDCESAHELLVAQYRRYGIDALVEFLVVEVDRDGSEYVEFRGKLWFPSIVVKAGQVAISVIQNTVHDKITARSDTPVALDLKLTLDNEAIVSPSTLEIPLPGQTIRETGEVSKRFQFFEPKEFSKPGIGGSYTLLPNLLWPVEKNPVPAETVAFQQMEGVRQLAGGIMQGSPDDFPLITATVAGSYALEIDWLTKINMGIHRQNAILEFGRVKYARWVIAPILVIKQPGKDDQTIQLQTPLTGSGETLSIGDQMVKVRYSGSHELIKGSKVYLFVGLIALTTKSLEALTFSANTTFLRVKIDRKTRAEASRTTAYMLPDVLKFVTGVITSNIDTVTKTGRVEGSLLELANSSQPFDGPATEYAVASGGQLRGITKAPTFTFKELIETLWAHHTAGILYQRDENDVETIRVEPGEWFYRGGEILQIDDVFEYEEEVDKSLLFNQLEVGYSKFPDEGPGVTEEFNTTRTYQTPLINEDAKQEILCPLIAAGTAIEAARRLGLTKTDENGKIVPTTDAGSYDDDNFILHIAAQTNRDTVQFVGRAPQKFPGRPIPTQFVQFCGLPLNNLFGTKELKSGDVVIFTGTGTANDGVPMTIIGLSKIKGLTTNYAFYPIYQVSAPSFVATPGPIPANWTQGGQPGKLRGDERLLVEGVTDPANTVNLELSPGRMLRKHALFINSGLYFKQAIDEIKCTAYKQNGKFITKARPEANPLPGDKDKQLVYDTGNVALGSLERFDKLFEPILIKVTGRITRQQLRLLRDALQNRADEAINMGYVSVLNPDGNYVSGYVRSLDYNPDSEIIDLVLRKKATERNPNGPNCEDYRDWTINRFETDKAADPNLYRFCRFSDFN